MIKRFYKYFSLIFILFLQVGLSYGQDGSAKATEKEKEFEKTVRFNGYGRTNIDNTSISGNILEGDSLTPREVTDGEFLLDLQVNATPNKTTEIQTIIRLRNEFGGFFGAGQSIEIRELWMRGIIANTFKYHVGDMDLVMSPYTLFSFDEDGTINEPAAFAPLRDIIYYEEFYTNKNTRRMQGASLDFGLNFNKYMKDMDFKGFLTRVRGTDFFTIPTRLVTGGSLKFTTDTWNDSLGMGLDFGFNLVYTFDDLQSGEATTGIRNTTYTFDFDYTILDDKKKGLHLVGEFGHSKLVSRNDSVTLLTFDDTFVDIGAKLHLKPQRLTLYAGISSVGPDFFNMAAQSKRIEYGATKTYYNRIGDDQFQRQAALFDLTRDPAIYTYQLSDVLMRYDPRFNNTFPYGKATPNRRGMNFSVGYVDRNKALEVSMDGALMQEIRGQGTTELKNFTLLKGSADLNINKWIDWENKLKFTFGYQFEQTNRGGVEVEQVNLTSNLVELGLEAELFEGFELLVGTKILDANGSDYIPRIEEFNIVTDFPGRYEVDETEVLLGGGVKYTFSEGIYLTVQYQTFTSQQTADASRDYGLGQVFALFVMKF
jgi:hypothetical protein